MEVEQRPARVGVNGHRESQPIFSRFSGGDVEGYSAGTTPLLATVAVTSARMLHY